MDRNPLTKRERMAYHEGGHAIIGMYAGIEIRCVTIEHDDGSLSFSALGEKCDLRRSPTARVRECVEPHIQLALGGCAGELVKLERHYGLDSRSPRLASFRREWQQKLFDESDLDLWYAMRLGDFLVQGDDTKLGDELTRIWDATFRLARSPSLWRHIEQLAERLLAGAPMSGEELIAIAEQVRRG